MGFINQHKWRSSPCIACRYFLGKRVVSTFLALFFQGPVPFCCFFSGLWHLKTAERKVICKRKNCGSNNFFMARMTYQHRSNFSIYFWDHVGKKLKQQTNNIKEGLWCLLWHIYIYIILWYKKRKQHSWNLQNSPEKRKKQSSALKILVLIASRSGFPWSPGKSRSPGKSWSPKFPTKGKAFLPVSGKLITWPWHEYMDAAGFLCISNWQFRATHSDLNLK